MGGEGIPELHVRTDLLRLGMLRRRSNLNSWVALFQEGLKRTQLKDNGQVPMLEAEVKNLTHLDENHYLQCPWLQMAL